MIIKHPTFVNLSDETRETMVDKHPVITKEYIILTPMIEKAYRVIRDRVWMRRTGTFLYAAPQTGKTSCSRAVELFLRNEFKNIYIIKLSADYRTTNSFAGLPSDILQSDGVALGRRAGYKERLSQLLVHIVASLGAEAGRQFILIIDEMQLLSKDDLSVLLVIHNRLQQKGIAMTTLGFAQPEIIHKKTSLIATNDYQLVARFLCEPIQFNGCASKNDLEYILNSYDEEKKYPEDSDWTYTRFFFPRAFKNNFRLRDYSDEIWGELQKVAEPILLSTIPMVHLTGTIEHILAANRKKDADDFKITKQMIAAAVESCGIYGFCDLSASSRV